MNANKAREFFSQYREGSLDQGMRQALERSFREDVALHAEYELFDRTLASLETFQGVAAEEPADLFERVSARVDRHVYEQNRRSPGRLGAWWRPLAIGGVAAAAILGALVSLRPGGDTFAAGLGGSASGAAKAVLEVQGGAYFVRTTEPAQGLATFRSGFDGPVLRTYDLRGQALDVRLANGRPAAALISVEGPWPVLRIALPGEAPGPAEGKGTVADLALAAASHYRIPVLLEVRDPSKRAEWRFAGSKGAEAVSGELSPPSLAFELREDALVLLQR